MVGAIGAQLAFVERVVRARWSGFRLKGERCQC